MIAAWRQLWVFLQVPVMATMTSPLAPLLEIAEGVFMPLIAFGTGECQGEPCVEMLEEAIKAGYRAIDTANQYDNQRQIGQAVRNLLKNPTFNLTRKDMFIISKVEGGLTGPETTARLEQDSNQLNLPGPLDLVLLHYPKNAPNMSLESTIKEQWQSISRFKLTGGARAVGVSQFSAVTLQMLDNSSCVWPPGISSGQTERPVVNQIGWHVGQGNDPQSLATLAKARGDLHLMAFSPLAEGNEELLGSQALLTIAGRHNVSVSQVALRWLVQREIPIAVAASSQQYQKENLELFLFSLTSQEMDAIDEINVPPGCPYWPGSPCWENSTCFGRLHNCCTVNPSFCPPSLPPCNSSAA